ncbi:MAG TPA: acetyl-CoA carboxylase biotin carboxylase subunit [Dehalococcoidia bacterium]|nr:acetyl-CoA carboxylase biotin carboxylase subunit [Dehalococcoidia bacterium]
MFKKILIANRGEIAVRVMRTCLDMGIRSVAVYSEADATALHARYADEAYCIGPAPAAQSYLNAAKIIEMAKACGAEAIHPGYGFLSEQAEFARACAAAGIVFIGPSPEALHMLGDKVEARVIADRAGAASVPGSDGRVSPAEALDLAPKIGYPLLIKAAAGGGGKGIRLVEEPSALEPALRMAATEAQASFGDDGIYLERYLDPVRHIEVQILADRFGNVVHLGERECSIQRRSQKLVEESPSVAVSPEQRRQLGAAAVAVARESGYTNAGTVEFLLDGRGDFYFIEANARLQVEHPVTELVTGLDLVEQQLRIAAGEPLSFTQDDVQIRGCAIECRITAEDADNGFLPSLGRIEHVSEPSGPGVRVDSSLFDGMEVGPHYDSLVAKLCVWGADRTQMLARLRRALDEYQVLGVKTTLPFHRALADEPAFVAGEIFTRYLDRRGEPELSPATGGDEALLIAALLSHARRGGGQSNGAAPRSGWKTAGREAALNRYGGDSWRNTF